MLESKVERHTVEKELATGGTKTTDLRQYRVIVDGAWIGVIGAQKNATLLFMRTVSDAEEAAAIRACVESDEVSYAGAASPPPISADELHSGIEIDDDE